MQDELINPHWSTLVDKATVDKTIEALKANNINALSVQNGAEAKSKRL